MYTHNQLPLRGKS